MFWLVFVGVMLAASSAQAQIRIGSGIPSMINNTVFHCYICNSFLDHRCADFFDNRTRLIEPCPGDKNYTMCRKIIQETYFDGAWDRRYIRDCAVHGEIGQEEGRWCTERLGTLRVKMRYCHCKNKHGCNGASGLFSAASWSKWLLIAASSGLAAVWLTTDKLVS
ncbi:hypothetical protein BOX15_Mlig017819g1 [Macrostomum lignano]|uniref:Protein quiver n=1 Tax=Macrostomum lignano TaxID=282301 RepID=A0A267G9E9_9PLAT|nr:hypothetical protein BOX15_Mlig017819g1 [Macrostomum lignano]